MQHAQKQNNWTKTNDQINSAPSKKACCPMHQAPGQNKFDKKDVAS